jgi:hypothetical protein
MAVHDEFLQRTFVAGTGASSFTVRHEFLVAGELRMRADMVHVCVSLATWEKLPVPEAIRAAGVAVPDPGLEATWRRQLTAAGLGCGPDDLRMLHATERTVGPLRDALVAYELGDVAPELVLDPGRAPRG